MRASRIILLLVAIVAGGLAAFLATRGEAPTTVVVSAPAEVIEEKKAQILVARTQIGVGQRLGEMTIEWQDWPELAVRPEYIKREAFPDALTEMSDSVARFEFFPGEPILEAKLVRASQGYLSAVIAQGMRAVSVEVTAASAAGGYVVPNDRVDVVLSRNENNNIISETLLTNVRVMAIGMRLGEAGTTGGNVDGEQDPRNEVFQNTAIATLELTPAQGETVINASRVGTLTLALRSMADFAEATSEMTPAGAGADASRSIRMIRFGREDDIMSGTSVQPSSPDISPAAFPQGSADTPGQPVFEVQ
ncbi:Flp pilus assembly protein CpaB [Devosia sp.]|uniref:Flp pilus assembly protein CpaB n=1 Tax=Devosia sp. TaxID=1871048 RepID=UPI003A90C15D